MTEEVTFNLYRRRVVSPGFDRYDYCVIGPDFVSGKDKFITDAVKPELLAHGLIDTLSDYTHVTRLRGLIDFDTPRPMEISFNKNSQAEEMITYSLLSEEEKAKAIEGIVNIYKENWAAREEAGLVV